MTDWALNPITVYGAAVERVNLFKFMGINITEDFTFTWALHTKEVVKESQQHLFSLRWLKEFGMGPLGLEDTTEHPGPAGYSSGTPFPPSNQAPQHPAQMLTQHLHPY